MVCECTTTDLVNFGCKCGYLDLQKKRKSQKHESTRLIKLPVENLSVDITDEHLITLGFRLGFVCHGSGEKVVVLFTYKDPSRNISQIAELTNCSSGIIGKKGCHIHSIANLIADGVTKYWVHVKASNQMSRLGLRRGKFKTGIVKQT
jgi:hypothetical protein